MESGMEKWRSGMEKWKRKVKWNGKGDPVGIFPLLFSHSFLFPQKKNKRWIHLSPILSPLFHSVEMRIAVWMDHPWVLPFQISGGSNSIALQFHNQIRTVAKSKSS
jgi:hypothetical protein